MKLFQKLKAWIIFKVLKFLTNKAWPNWQYHADYIDQLNEWHLVYRDVNGILPDKDIVPNRRDLTNFSVDHFHSDSVFKKCSHTLFKNVSLKTGKKANVLVIPKQISIKEYLELMKTNGPEYGKTILEEVEVSLDKVVHIDFRVMANDFLTEAESLELRSYVARRLISSE